MFNQIKIHKIPGEDNVADIGTKALDRSKFQRFRDLLYNHSMTFTYLGRCDSLIDSNYVKAPHDINLDINQTLLIYNTKYESDGRQDIIEQLYYMYS